MTYSEKINLASSEKNFLAILSPAVIIGSWTLDSGTVYYNDFSISTEFLEYVVGVSVDGVDLASSLSTPSSGEYYWDWNAKRLYINTGGDPAPSIVVVEFNVYFGTKSTNTYRIPTDDSSESVYYEPRIMDATIPAVNNEDLQLYGSSGGSLKLNNMDGALYIYDSVSFVNKRIQIFQFVDELENLELYYQGRFKGITSIDDDKLTLAYGNIDSVFSDNFRTGNVSLYSDDDYPSINQDYLGSPIRYIYGKIDDIAAVNIDSSDTPTTSNNRDWAVRADATNAHQLNYSVLASPSSTTTRVYVGAHFLQVDDAIKVTISATPYYTNVTAVGSNYIDVSPTLGATPGSGDTVDRSTIGYIKIKDKDANIFTLAYGRDYIETTFANDVLGFTLTNNFESNHGGLSLFDPSFMVLYCRCYGKKHATINDSNTGNLTAGNLVVLDILQNRIGLTPEEIDTASITGISSKALSFVIPEDQQGEFPNYRDVFNTINQSLLSQVYINSDEKIDMREIGPLSASELTMTDKDLIKFSVSHDSDDISDEIRVKYGRREFSNGSNLSTFRSVLSSSSVSKYLHGKSTTQEFETYLLNQADAQEIANRYSTIYTYPVRSYAIDVKLQLAQKSIGSVIALHREKLPRYNYLKGTQQTINIIITKIKKTLTGIKVNGDDQKSIEDNSGSW